MLQAEVTVEHHRNAHLARGSGGEGIDDAHLDATREIAEQIAEHLRGSIPPQVRVARPISHIKVEVCCGATYWHYREQYWAPEGLPGVRARASQVEEVSAQLGFRIWAGDEAVLLAGCVSVRPEAVEVLVGSTPFCLTSEHAGNKLFRIASRDVLPAEPERIRDLEPLKDYALLAVTSWMFGFDEMHPYLAILREAAVGRLHRARERGVEVEGQERAWLERLLRLVGPDLPILEAVEEVFLEPVLRAATVGVDRPGESPATSAAGRRWGPPPRCKMGSGFNTHAWPCCDARISQTSKDRSVSPVQAGSLWYCDEHDQAGWHPVGPYNHRWMPGIGYVPEVSTHELALRVRADVRQAGVERVLPAGRMQSVATKIRNSWYSVGHGITQRMASQGVVVYRGHSEEVREPSPTPTPTQPRTPEVEAELQSMVERILGRARGDT